jgi:hypothetical protein
MSILKDIFPLYFVVLAIGLANCAKNDPSSQGSDGANGNGGSPTINESQLKIPTETCRPIPAADKVQPPIPGVAGGPQIPLDFYTLAEDTTRFPIPRSQSAYVIGDIHGSWQMIMYAAINSGLMELDAPAKKSMTIKFRSQDQNVEIPNLKFKADGKNKLIFLGDYIAKNDQAHEQTTLALLTDILEKQKSVGGDSIVAVIGNHDLEAVNGVVHPGYPSEKNYRDQVMYMVQSGLLVPTYFYHGIWFSHSYLTQDDLAQLNLNGINFNVPNQTSKDVNAYVTQQITAGTLRATWLASPSEKPPHHAGPFNFFYTMTSPVAQGAGFQKFPIIMGHLSDLHRKTLRVLVEGFRGAIHSKFRERSHILCTDTSIFDSFARGTHATFLKIDYDAAAPSVQFNSCIVPTKQ